jgi:alkylation response protein AidB-like acyl-CoA dehydrogenase
VLLRLGEVAALVEGTALLTRRAARAAEGTLAEKASHRFDAEALAAINRVNARDVALRVGTDAVRWVAGTGNVDGGGKLVAAVRLPAIYAAQEGLLADLDAVADVVYGR